MDFRWLAKAAARKVSAGLMSMMRRVRYALDPRILSLRLASSFRHGSGLNGEHAVTVSIVIPVYNKKDLTIQCLGSLLQSDAGVEYEVIVVDNASDDGTVEAVRALDAGTIKLITNRSNLGFARACNQGAMASSGKYVLFLNNDTILGNNWLKPLVDAVESDPSVGVAGPKLVYPETGRIQHAGMVFGANSFIPYHIYHNFPARHYAVNRKRYFQAITGACMLVPRWLFYGVGMFDEGFVNGGEDTDLCLKVRGKGLKALYEPASEVLHLEGMSPGRSNNIAANRKRLVSRWSGKVERDDAGYYGQDGFVVEGYERDNADMPDEIALFRPRLALGPGDILVVKPSGIGNMILFTPALRCIKQIFPGRRIVIACFQAESEIIRGIVDDVIILKSPDPSTGRMDLKGLDDQAGTGRYIMAVYPPYTDIPSPTPALRSGIPVHIVHPHVDFFNRHEVEHNMDIARMLGWEGGIPPLYAPTSEPPNGLLPDKYIAIHPGASGTVHCQKKKWPVERWAELLGMILPGTKVVILGGKDEANDAADIIGKIDPVMRNAVTSLAGRLTIQETASAIKSAELLVSNDSGLMHLATAVGTPVVGIFGPTLPSKNRPWGEEDVNRVVRRDLECGPCYYERARLVSCEGRECLTGISAEMIMDEIYVLRGLNDKRCAKAD